MRISDWSSDVCSSDLKKASCSHQPRIQRQRSRGRSPNRENDRQRKNHETPPDAQGRLSERPQRLNHSSNSTILRRDRRHRSSSQQQYERRRSEEHTSELQSLMRISYAVFCLKKKIKY